MHGPAIQPAYSASPPLGGLYRRGRSLIGWLPPEIGHALLLGGDGAAEVPPEIEVRARAAREYVSHRQPVRQGAVVGQPPTTIGDHLAALRENAAQLFAEGFRICTVDLANVYAIQPTTFLDHCGTTLDAVKDDDTLALAEITLPLAREVRLNFATDATQRSITLVSPDLNLQVVGPTPPQMGPTGCVVGFHTTVSNSLLQIAHHEGRYFCRDGHTRALQLLQHGITKAPALVKQFDTYAEVAPRPNLFPEAVTLGANPPTLSDFLDDRCAADVSLPLTRKAILISAVEVELPV